MVALFAALALVHDPLHVQGDRLMEDGAEVRLHGVLVPSMESSVTGKNVYRSCRVLLEDWNANCAELPVSQDRWFGRSPDQKEHRDEYKFAIDDLVNLFSRRNQYLIIELASTDAGDWGKHEGPHTAPDRHSLDFWKDVAHRYRGVEHLLLKLYPPTTLDPAAWLNGGDIDEAGLKFSSPGIQKIMDSIRSVGSKNVVILCPPLGTSNLTVADKGGNGMMVVSNAPFSGSNFALLSELNHSTSDPRSLSGSWVASQMTVGDPDSLIQDWAYTPTPWGQTVKSAVKG